MLQHFVKPAFQVLTIVSVALLIVIAMRAIGALALFAPLSRSRRERLTRILPVLSVFIYLGYAWVSIRWLLAGMGNVQAVVLLVVLTFIGAVLWAPMRDYISGVVLKAGRVVRAGDQVAVAGITGKVQRLGFRALTVETTAGEEAIIPYSRISPDAVLRTPVVEGVSLHGFEVRAKPGITAREVRHEVRVAVLTCPWASVVRDPGVKALGDQRYEVSVFALEPDFAPEIEAAVRQAAVFE